MQQTRWCVNCPLPHAKQKFFEGMNLLKLNPEVIEKQMTKDAMGTIQRVLGEGKRAAAGQAPVCHDYVVW
ncbi:TP901 family phage tail tape measure protein [Escherichia coli]|nr:TP901 family phage tail tape measure protein [Escherichia coli]